MAWKKIPSQVYLSETDAVVSCESAPVNQVV